MFQRYSCFLLTQFQFAICMFETHSMHHKQVLLQKRWPIHLRHQIPVWNCISGPKYFSSVFWPEKFWPGLPGQNCRPNKCLRDKSFGMEWYFGSYMNTHPAYVQKYFNVLYVPWLCYICIFYRTDPHSSPFKSTPWVVHSHRRQKSRLKFLISESLG